MFTMYSLFFIYLGEFNMYKNDVLKMVNIWDFC